MVGGSTAIGSGIATSVKRLKDSEAKSKVIILLTDGVNTNNEITPRTAAEIAKTFDIKLYIIGIGKRKFTEVIKDRFGRKRRVEKETKIDIKEMTEISELTGGKFFRATDQEALKNIYEEIDQLEKTELASLKYYKKTELFLPFALIGLLLIVISKTLSITIFKTIE
jgi:Ca-activated chloride channel family protein